MLLRILEKRHEGGGRQDSHDGVRGVAATFGKRVTRQPDVETGAELRPDGAQMTGPAHEQYRPSADIGPFSFCRSPSPPCRDYARDIMPTTGLCRVGWPEAFSRCL